MSDTISIILSKARDSQAEAEELERQILAGLDRSPDASLTVVPHLYDLSAGGAGMEAIRAIDGDMIVLGWLYPRAAYWVLGANGVRGRLAKTSSLPEEDYDEPASAFDDSERSIWCFDLRTHDRAEPYLAEISEILAASHVPAGEEAAAAGNGRTRVLDEATRPRWYPVVDFHRCTNCLECLNFCLFGVFGLDENDAILIEQPDACRAGCPACSRICPQGAIMFPQHKDPAIAGDPKLSREGLKLDLSRLFSDISPAELAARERDKALKEQQSHLDKPSDDEAADSTERNDLDQLVDDLDDLDL
jgi:hypothetical protein